MADDFEIGIWDRPENDDLYAEITFAGQIVAEITQEEGYEALDLAIFPRDDGEPWSFKLASLEGAFSEAKRRLWDLRRPEQTDG